LPQSLVARLLIVAVALIASALLTAFVTEARDVARYMSGQTFAMVVAGFLIVAVTLVASALLTEFVLEARDVARYMPGQTFATVGGARIRYRLIGAERPGVFSEGSTAHSAEQQAEELAALGLRFEASTGTSSCSSEVGPDSFWNLSVRVPPDDAVPLR
jgi:FlaA1/EpsC-like NDP-sugar epimerase